MRRRFPTDPDNCGAIDSGDNGNQRCAIDNAWTAAEVNYVVGVTVTADLLTEPNHLLTMNLESEIFNLNLDSVRYEINTERDASDLPLAAVVWRADNANVFAVTPLATLNSDGRAELTEGGALLPVTLSITVNAPPSGVPVVFNIAGTEFNEVAVYNNALSLLAPVGVNYQATIGDGLQFTVVQVSAIVNVDLTDELWTLTVTSPDESGSLPITVTASDDIVVQLGGNVNDAGASVPASAVFPEHRGVILLTIRTWLRDGASSVPLTIQPGESVEFSFAGNPAPDDINIADSNIPQSVIDAFAACSVGECPIRWQNPGPNAVSDFIVTLTSVLDFADEGSEIFNYEFGDLRPSRLGGGDVNAELPIYRLRLTNPPVGDFDSQAIEAAINTQILITVNFVPTADVADVRAELRLHFRGADVANASASGVDFRRNTPDLECTNAGVPSGVTSMCDLNSTFALVGGNAVITLFADVNLNREVQVSLFNRRVENRRVQNLPRDDLLFRDNEARIIFSPLLVHAEPLAGAQGAEGQSAFVVGTVVVSVSTPTRTEATEVTLSVGLVGCDWTASVGLFAAAGDDSNAGCYSEFRRHGNTFPPAHFVDGCEY